MRSIIVCLAVAVVLCLSSGIESTKICIDNCNQAVQQPLCAVNYWAPYAQRTFANRCLLDLYNCRWPLAQYYEAAAGVCPADGVLVCGTTCPTDYTPVCGAQLRNWFATYSFNNYCELVNYNCANNLNSFVQTLNTACPRDTITTLP